MVALSWFLTRDNIARLVLALTLAFVAITAFFATKVEQDDNVLAFLPKDNADVKTFYDVSGRFGSLDVALVGVGSDDVFEKDFLSRLAEATKKLNQTDGIEYALSLTSVEDYAADPSGGVSTDYLVHKLPETAVDKEALRARVLGNDNVVGNLVSKDGKGIVLYCFLRHGVDPHLGASKVRQIVSDAFPSEAKYWGGSPFISTYIYDITQRDLKKLAPWACVAIVVLMLSSFRDVVGMLIALFSSGAGIVMTLGIMGMLGVRSNIVLGSMPVILFALGSAPPVHILTRYYFHRQTNPNREAIREAMRDKGLVVIASAATVIAGLGSFITMDIAPMRVFGIFTSIGIVLTLLMAVFFVPAAIRVFNLKGKPTLESAILSRATASIVNFARGHKMPVFLAMLALAGVCAFGIRSVDTRMDNAAFFDPGSEPDRADQFMRDKFGGAQFVQVWVQGDMTNPYVLREVQRIGDAISEVPDVSSVTHIGQVVSATNDALEGIKRIPDTEARVKTVLSFLTGKRAVSQLIDDERTSALLNVKLSSSEIGRVEKALSNIENVVHTTSVQAFVLADRTGPRGAEVTARQVDYALPRVIHVLQAADPDSAADIASTADAIAASLRPADGQVSKLDPKHMSEALALFMKSDEFIGDLPKDPAALPAVALAVANLPLDPAKDDLRNAVAKALGRPSDDAAVLDVSDSLTKPLAELQRKEARRAQSMSVIDAAGIFDDRGARGPSGITKDREKLAVKLGDALTDLSLPKALLSADGADPEGKISTEVTGLPVLYRGLSRSVEKNQVFSLLSAVFLVALTMTVMFRSLASGLLSAVPALFTIIAVYGGMGLLHVHLDIGTSMLASLIIGAGVDYAIHFLGAWRSPSGSVEEAAKQAAEVSGPGIWTNALMVAAGFFVLTLGEARPLKHVGTLTALAMVVASLATFLLVPIFARKPEYVRLGTSSSNPSMRKP